MSCDIILRIHWTVEPIGLRKMFTRVKPPLQVTLRTSFPQARWVHIAGLSMLDMSPRIIPGCWLWSPGLVLRVAGIDSSRTLTGNVNSLKSLYSSIFYSKICYASSSTTEPLSLPIMSSAFIMISESHFKAFLQPVYSPFDSK